MKKLLHLSLLAAGLSMLASAAVAQTYPSKPIKLILPFGAGAASDAVARSLTERVGKALGTTFVIENKAGANGSIAAQEVARATPDGYTIMMSSNSAHAANVHLYKTLNYDPVKDFVAITSLTKNPLVLVVRSQIPVKDIKEFIAHAKANPDKLNFGVGNSSSLANAHLFMTMTGTKAVQANYRALPAALIDLLGGRLDFIMIDPFLVNEHIKSGALRPLGVTSATRLQALPDVPAIAEAVPGYELVGWIGAFAPAGTPPDVVAKLNKAFVDAVNAPETGTQLNNLAMQPFPSSSEQFGSYVKEQIGKWGEIMTKAGVQKE